MEAAGGKTGIKGEETLISLIVLKSALSLVFRSQYEEWFVVTDWSFVFVACKLLGVFILMMFCLVLCFDAFISTLALILELN
jgi:hypothetical protein